MPMKKLDTHRRAGWDDSKDRIGLAWLYECPPGTFGAMQVSLSLTSQKPASLCMMYELSDSYAVVVDRSSRSCLDIRTTSRLEIERCSDVSHGLDMSFRIPPHDSSIEQFSQCETNTMYPTQFDLSSRGWVNTCAIHPY